MMAPAQLLDVVVSTVREVSPAVADRPIDGSSRLVEDLGLDSLDLVSLLMSLQDKLAIELDLDAVGGLAAIDDVVALVGQLPRQAA